MRPLDTSLDAYRLQIRAYRAMTSAERLWLAATMSDEVRRLAIVGLARRRLDLTPESLAGEFERIRAVMDAATARPPATDR